MNSSEFGCGYVTGSKGLRGVDVKGCKSKTERVEKEGKGRKEEVSLDPEVEGSVKWRVVAVGDCRTVWV